MMNCTWTQLRPGCVHERAFVGFEPPSDDSTDVLLSIIDFKVFMLLQLGGEITEELMYEHSEEITIEESQDFHLKMQ